MLKPMFGNNPKPKKFDMPLRYYDPEKDREDRKERIKFERHHTRGSDKQGLRVIMYAAGLGMIIWVMSLL